MGVVQETFSHEKFKVQLIVEKMTDVAHGGNWKIVSIEFDGFERFTPKGLRELGAWLICQGTKIGNRYSRRGVKKQERSTPQ